MLHVYTELLLYIDFQEVMTALDRFSRYHHIWRKDREDTMRKYDKLNDGLIFISVSSRLDTTVLYIYTSRREAPCQHFLGVCVFHRFIQDSPLLSEFESQIIFYRDLELEINSEPEFIAVGALALFTG